MENFIAWANLNNGFLTLVLTCVSALATATAVIVSIWANRISSKNLKQALQFEKNRNRPYVIFDIEHDKSLLHAKLKNLGQSAALNISIKIEPALEANWGRELNVPSLIANSISFLAPDRTISDFVGAGHEFYKRYEDPKFTGLIEYTDSEGERYQERFFLDLTYLKGLSHTMDPEVGREIKNLVKEVHDISRVASRMERQLNTMLKEEEST